MRYYKGIIIKNIWIIFLLCAVLPVFSKAEDDQDSLEELIHRNTPALQEEIGGKDRFESLLEEERFRIEIPRPSEVFLMEKGYQDIPQLMIEIGDEKLIGRDAYVNAQVTLVDPSGTYRIIKDNEAQIKIRGNFTAYRDKKPYNIKLSGKASLLGMSEGKKWCILANRYDKSLIHNKLVLDFARDLRFAYTPEAEYVDLWMNGKYRGNYLIVTPVDVKANRVDIEIEDGDFLLEREASRTEEGVTYVKSPIYGFRLAINEPEVPTPQQLEEINAFLKEVDEAIASKDYERISQIIDLDSFIDFYLVNEFFKNQDVDFSSTRFYRKNGVLYAGPLWDFDLSMGNLSPYTYAAPYINATDTFFALKSVWIQKLLEVDEVYRLFANRFWELQPKFVNVYEDNELGTNQIDLLMEQYQEALLRDSQVAGWAMVSCGLDMEPFPTYMENVEYARSFLKARNEWLTAHVTHYEPEESLTSRKPEETKSNDESSEVEIIEDGNQ